jgi:pilus assembly protein CpaD
MSAMTKTQKAHLPSLSSTQAKAWCIIGAALMFTTGCGGGYAARREPAPVDPVLQSHLQRTVLEAHTPTAVPVEARLVLEASDGAQGLTGQEYSQLTAFANDFVQLGRGTLVISVPANAGNSATAAAIAQDAQRALYAGGVDFAKISGGTYQAQGRPNAPIMLSFARYEAVKVTCQPWSEIDPRKTASNLSPNRFGCTQNANLAAMVADPGDLLGDRRDGPRDAGRIQVGVDAQRKGDVKAVSGSVAGGGQ